MTKNSSYWIYGKHAALSALENEKRNILQICATDISLVKSTLNTKHPKPQIVTNKYLDELVGLNATHQGIAIRTSPLVSPPIESIFNQDFILVLDQITDPHNIGAILRSSLAFNFRTIIVPQDNFPGENAVIAKTASGALEKVSIIKVVNISRTLELLKKNNFWCIGLDSNTNTYLNDIPDYKKVALVMGAEGQGIRPNVKNNCDLLTKIKMSDDIDSLNVSNAAAIAMYNFYQR